MEEQVIYTIGYAHHTQESFLELLLKYHINCVIDVRTMAYSGFHPQFNKEIIKAYLKQHGIAYLHMDQPFGIIKDKIELNTKEGYLDFTKLAKTDKFLEGVSRVQNGLEKGYHIAFMCAEKDPTDCHRSTLVARALYEMGYEVKHILYDGSVETHQHMEERMKEKFAPDNGQIDLFRGEQSEEDRLEEAYAKCSKEIFIVNAKRVLKDDYDFPKPNPNA
ncbi:DUF488 domain-containing protein [Niameybacter massiliensis]|uniref:DUF488 domain-containing protein n=1 Tax=Holtiella tumoricola TaxID=3018743 RepID=A0AA42DPW6_9FIRM|nr:MULTISPECIES: DUF488 domain-containing protein [Lachnospirales]MDA3732983.1 DUF488 domain-containing protein [Holtiella tumoricola]